MQKRLKAELDHINEMREKCQKKGEESLATFIEEKCKEMKKKNIVVDLDATLAHYDEWMGVENIGDPLPGAQEFIEALMEKYNVIIFTTRTSTTVNKYPPDQVNRLAGYVMAWLKKHKFPPVGVWVGDGKPIADFYIDDRAVNCAPQKDPDAYWKVLEVVR